LSKGTPWYQQRLHAWAENRIAHLDGVSAVAQLMRQANLPRIGAPVLRAINVRDPNRGPMNGAIVSMIGGSET
jgi:hypothetical protein